MRRLSPGGYEYLTGTVACADRGLEPGESLSDYYLANGYPAGEWFGQGASELGVSGEVSAAQMNALFGEGRHPDADRIEADMIAAGATPEQALRETRLGRRFAQFGGADALRRTVGEAYKQHNLDNGRRIGARIDNDTRAEIRLRVQTQAFKDAHQGAAPEGEELAKWLAEQKRAMKTAVAGYEMVLAPPKSYSVAWAVTDDTTREQLVTLHRQAVKDTLTHFENNAAFTRKGNSGEAQVDVTGITAAIFEHWDSRAGDPHLHTHVPISAKVKRADDGRWTVLDTRTIHAAAVTMSEFYNSRIRDLSREQGAHWVQRPSGGIDLKRPVWELADVPNELIAWFSQRAQQIETDRASRIVDYRAAHGHEPGPKQLLEISRRAQYGTRTGKQAPRSLRDHVTRWRGMAESVVGAEVLDGLAGTLFGGPGEPVDEADIAKLAELTRFVVAEGYSHWNRWNVEAEAHRQTAHLRVPAGGRDALITRIADAVITAPDTVALAAPELSRLPLLLRRRSGESVFIEHNTQRYTTEQTLREEAALVSWARRGGGHRITAATVRQALAGKDLNAGQTRMVTEFSRSGRRLQLALAPAGAGKTTAMRVFADAWRSAGGRVYAFGPSARAAQELGESIQATPHTLHQLTTALAMGHQRYNFAFRAGDMLVIDEAAMAGTHTLHTAIRYALRRGADVRMIGDDRQLGAVEAGGAIRLIAHDVGAVRFKEVVRFADPDQAAASLLLATGDPAGLDYYFEKHWVSSGSRETMRDAAHTAWRADLDANRETLLIVPVNEDVVSLNLQARAQRIETGSVKKTRQTVLHDGTAASRGDWVVTRDNHRALTLFGGRDFVKNGDTWQVTAVRRDGSLTVAHRVHGGRITLPADYVAAEVELAYATTINRAEGMTSKGSAHEVVPQNMTREQLYTGSTRAVHDNRLYVETHHHVIDSHQETPPEQDARSVLVGVLGHSGVEISATEQLRASLDATESLGTLVAMHNYAARLNDEARYEELLTRHAPQTLDAPAEAALTQTLSTAEDLGWRAEHLLSAALAVGTLADAEDPAALLQHRIQQRLEHDTPPPRTAEPDPAGLTRWHTMFDRHAPGAQVQDPRWGPMWRLAAGATTAGLDAEVALTRTAEHLAARPAADPMGDHDYAEAVLRNQLDQQRAAGRGWRAALPWMARPDHDLLARQPDLADSLRELDTTIARRVGELRDRVAAEHPAWAARLGERPTQPEAGARWDHLAGLAAAYRETYNITSDTPGKPLGPEPDTNGLKALAWKDLTADWHPPTAELRTDGPTTPSESPATSIEVLRASLGDDGLAAALAAADETPARETEDPPLAELAARHERAVRLSAVQDRDERIIKTLDRHAPQVHDQPGESGLLAALRRAEQHGWRVEQLVPDAVNTRSLDGADDPAAVLAWRIQQTVTRREAPPREPRADAPLPWLTGADPAVLASHPELAAHLRRLAEAIDARVGELRDTMADDQPAWTSGLGPRPQTPEPAERWDRLAGLGAAYRETHRITGQDPDSPLGAKPGGDGPRARAWTQLADRWRPPATTAHSELSSRNQDSIDQLREQVLANSDHTRADAAAAVEDHRDDHVDLGDDLIEDDAYGLDVDHGLGTGLGL